MLDLRVPTGLFFSATGITLTILGLFVPGKRAALSDANVNLYSGLAMIVFGAFLLLLAFRKRS